jgi:opacity protein-like surface antigen
MKLVRVMLTAATLTVAAAGAAQAQFAVEGRVGGAIPMGDDFGDAASNGFGLEANASFGILPLVDLYAGASWTRFGIESDGEDVDADFTDTGFFAGARVGLPAGPIQPWVRGGVIYNQLEASGEDGGVSVSVESERAVGFEIGGGISFSVMPMVSITPGVRYRSYSPDFNFGDETGSADVNYLTIDVGARIGL